MRREMLAAVGKSPPVNAIQKSGSRKLTDGLISTVIGRFHEADFSSSIHIPEGVRATQQETCSSRAALLPHLNGRHSDPRAVSELPSPRAGRSRTLLPGPQ